MFILVSVPDRAIRVDFEFVKYQTIQYQLQSVTAAMPARGIDRTHEMGPIVNRQTVNVCALCIN